jgi:hypothetical protein
MADMIEKNFVGERELAVCFGLCSFHMRTFSQAIPLFRRPVRASGKQRGHHAVPSHRRR